MIDYKLFLTNRDKVEEEEYQIREELRDFFEHFIKNALYCNFWVDEIAFGYEMIEVIFAWGYDSYNDSRSEETFSFPIDIIEDHSTQRAEEFAKQFKADKDEQESKRKEERKLERKAQMEQQIERLKHELMNADRENH